MSEKRQGFNDWKPHEQFRHLALVGRPDGDMREGRSAFRAAIRTGDHALASSRRCRQRQAFVRCDDFGSLQRRQVTSTHLREHRLADGQGDPRYVEREASRRMADYFLAEDCLIRIRRCPPCACSISNVLVLRTRSLSLRKPYVRGSKSDARLAS